MAMRGLSGTGCVALRCGSEKESSLTGTRGSRMWARCRAVSRLSSTGRRPSTYDFTGPTLRRRPGVRSETGEVAAAVKVAAGRSCDISGGGGEEGGSGGIGRFALLLKERRKPERGWPREAGYTEDDEHDGVGFIADTSMAIIIIIIIIALLLDHLVLILLVLQPRGHIYARPCLVLGVIVHLDVATEARLSSVQEVLDGIVCIVPSPVRRTSRDGAESRSESLPETSSRLSIDRRHAQQGDGTAGRCSLHPVSREGHCCVQMLPLFASSPFHALLKVSRGSRV